MAVIVVMVQAVVLYFPAAVPVLSGHENDDYDANGGDDSDDIHIYNGEVYVCMYVTFLLISFSPISGHFWV